VSDPDREAPRPNEGIAKGVPLETPRALDWLSRGWEGPATPECQTVSKTAHSGVSGVVVFRHLRGPEGPPRATPE